MILFCTEQVKNVFNSYFLYTKGSFKGDLTCIKVSSLKKILSITLFWDSELMDEGPLVQVLRLFARAYRNIKRYKESLLPSYYREPSMSMH